MGTRVGKFMRYGALLWPGLMVAALLCAQVVPCFYMSADSAAYVELARNLASGRGYLFNEERFYGYPPVFPGMLAAGILVFGDSIVMMRAVVVLSAVGFLAASFFLIRRFVGWRAALFVVWLFGLSVVPARWATYLMSDLAGAMFAALALIAILRVERSDQRRARFGGATAGAIVLTLLAVFTRTANVSLVAAVVLCYFVLRRDRFSRGTLRTMAPLVLIVLACLAVWFTVVFTSGVSFHRQPFLPLLESHKDWDSGYLGPLELVARTFRGVPAWLETLSSVLIVGTGTVSAWIKWVLVAFFLLGLGVGFVRRRGVVEAFTLVALVLPMGTPFAAGGSRYYIVIGPLAFMYVYEGVAWLVGLAERLSPQRRAAVSYAAGGLLVLPLLLMAAGHGPLGGARGWFGDWKRALVAVAFSASMIVGLLGGGRRSFRRLCVPVASALLLVVWTAIQLGVIVPRLSELRKLQHDNKMYYRYTEPAAIAKELVRLAGPNDACVSSEPRLYRGLTSLRSYRFPLTRKQNQVLEAFELGRWVIVDLERPEDIKFALPVIESHPDLFELVAQNDRMQLYRRKDGIEENTDLVPPQAE